ncbi:MAG: VOC family protein [Gemmatimonadota bacterium]|nr:VOC family protein [Gemmatimonadota bacterium]
MLNDNSPVLEAFPYLCARGAAAAIEFYVNVFEARVGLRLEESSGRIAHAEFTIGPMTFMIADEYPEVGIFSPSALGGTGLRIHLHVRNVDDLTSKAAMAGATILLEPTDQPHGERQSRVRDPFGHEWLLGQAIEDLTTEEIQQRFREW